MNAVQEKTELHRRESSLEISQNNNQSRAITVKSPEINQSRVVDCGDVVGSQRIKCEKSAQMEAITAE